MLARIVIVEDDENWIKIIKDSLEENLKKGAYKVFSIKYENEITTLNEVVAIEPDFAILDINMANSSRAGIRLAEKIKRKIPNLEFRFLTSQKEKDPDILWDIAKLSPDAPFEKADFQDNMELFVKFISNIVENKFDSSDSVVRGPLKIIGISRAVFLHDKEIKFTPMVYEILLRLAQKPNLIYSKFQLYNRTKKYEVSEGTSEDTVVSHIKSIRDKLKKIDKDFNPIVTVTNSGYKYNYRRDTKF